MMRWDVAGFVGAARQAMPIRWVVQGPHALQPGQRAQLQARLQNFLTQCRLSRAPTQWANGALPDGSRYRLYAHNGATEVVVQPASPTFDKSKGLLLGGLVRCVGAMVGPAPGGQPGTVPWYQFFKENKARPTDVPKYVATRKLYAKPGQQTPQETFATFWRHNLTGAAALWAQFGRSAGALYADYFTRIGVAAPTPEMGVCVLITQVEGKPYAVALNVANQGKGRVTGLRVQVVEPVDFGVEVSKVPPQLLALFGGIPIPPMAAKWNTPDYIISEQAILSTISGDATVTEEHANTKDFGAVLHAFPGSDHADWMVGWRDWSTVTRRGAHMRVGLVVSDTVVSITYECRWQGYASWQEARNSLPDLDGVQVRTNLTHDHQGLVTFTRERTFDGNVRLEMTQIRGTSVSEDVLHMAVPQPGVQTGGFISLSDDGSWSASSGHFTIRVLNHVRIEIEPELWEHSYDLQYTYRATSERTGVVRYDIVNGGSVQFLRTPGVWGVHTRDADGWENNGYAEVTLDYTRHTVTRTRTPDYYETTISTRETDMNNVSTDVVIAYISYMPEAVFEGSSTPMEYVARTQRTDYANWRLNKSVLYVDGVARSYDLEGWLSTHIPWYSAQLMPPDYLSDLPRANSSADAYMTIERSHLGGVQMIPRLVNVGEQIKPPAGLYVGSLVKAADENAYNNSVDIFCIGSTQE
ncbi:hypothetical protein [Comamonas aquatica]|uniref:Uncharacterized protein n=1 Tax=Comamonas aquatica TaxID=225991 RepID=A0AA35GJS4_9BURK|nr:hypothetical protein [Comamonas aquatica]CAB5675167.1 Uncharacterised protein [Comamonas aquatica]CAC9685852.1 Uncharacterised protein [Comamonas aquatica]